MRPSRLPTMLFKAEFSAGYEDELVRQVLRVHHKEAPEVFARYPASVREAVLADEAGLLLRYNEKLASNVVKGWVLDRVVAHLESRGIRALPLKGMFLFETVFRDYPGLRGMCDVDVLVPAADYERSKQVMREIGQVGIWNRERPLYSGFYHEYPVHIDGVLVEIHRGQNIVDAFRMDYSRFFDEELFVEGRFGSFEHMVCFYLVHDANDGLQAFDYARAARMRILLCNSDLERLVGLCEEFGIGELLSLNFYLSERLFEAGAELRRPPEVVDRSWFRLIVPASGWRPFAVPVSDWLFKLMVFRNSLLQKTVYNLITWLPDRVGKRWLGR